MSVIVDMVAVAMLGAAAPTETRVPVEATVIPPTVLANIRRQCGLIAHHQIRKLVPDPVARRAIYRNPDLEAATCRVLRHVAVPWSREQDILVGVLDAGPGAILWGKSGAAHWGVGRFRSLPPHVAVPRRRVKGPRAAQIHQVRHLAADEQVTHLDIPTARPETVILWLAGMWTHRLGHELALERAKIDLDQAWRQRLIDGHFIHDLADRSGGKGRSGIVVLRALLENRPPDYQPAGSRLEERFEDVVGPSVAGLLARQVTVDAETAVRTVDFRVCDQPKIFEINGEAFHTSISDREADDERYRRLLDLGYSVMVLWEHDIWHDRRTVQRAAGAFVRTRDAAPTLHRPTKAPWEW